MKFAGIKELKQKTMDLIKESEKEDILITAYGKPAAILHHITEEDLADYIIEADPIFREKIETAYEDFLKFGGTSIEREISALEKKLERE